MPTPAIVQSIGPFTATGTSDAQAFSTPVSAGSAIVVLIGQPGANNRTFSCSDNINGAYSNTLQQANSFRQAFAGYYLNSSGGSMTVTTTSNASNGWLWMAFEVSDADEVDVALNPETSSGLGTHDLFDPAAAFSAESIAFGISVLNASASMTEPVNWTEAGEDTNVQACYRINATSVASDSGTCTESEGTRDWASIAFALKATGGGGGTEETITDGISITDSAIVTRRIKPSVIDTLLLQELNASSRTQHLTLTDSINLGTAVVDSLFVGEVIDTLLVSDSLTAVLKKSGSVSDTFVLNDEATASNTITISLTDSFSLSDTSEGINAGGALINESLSLTDTVGVQGTFNLSSPESFSLQDEVQEVRTTAALITESLLLTDSVEINQGLGGAIVEGLLLFDTVSSRKTSLVSVDETITITDTAGSQQQFTISLSDSLLLQETAIGITAFAGFIAIKDVTGNLSKAVTVGKISIAIGTIK